MCSVGFREGCHHGAVGASAAVLVKWPLVFLPSQADFILPIVIYARTTQSSRLLFKELPLSISGGFTKAEAS